ncbi:hypothetical protein WR25_11952 [Diploscapter pachys]|uniref:Uncharacterized protein n=1 Tax=Diploscapter pachys TaxID=2018661 RepID=A0A2A2LK15_9BILA|nr:hypothetical protein WR25_11952 [Diploscapter pachys]
MELAPLNSPNAPNAPNVSTKDPELSAPTVPPGDHELRKLKVAIGVLLLVLTLSVMSVLHTFWKIEDDYLHERHEYCRMANQSFTFTFRYQQGWYRKELFQLQQAPKESLSPEKKERVKSLKGKMNMTMPDYYAECVKVYRGWPHVDKVE